MAEAFREWKADQVRLLKINEELAPLRKKKVELKTTLRIELEELAKLRGRLKMYEMVESMHRDVLSENNNIVVSNLEELTLISKEFGSSKIYRYHESVEDENVIRSMENYAVTNRLTLLS